MDPRWWHIRRSQLARVLVCEAAAIARGQFALYALTMSDETVDVRQSTYPDDIIFAVLMNPVLFLVVYRRIGIGFASSFDSKGVRTSNPQTIS